MLSGGHAALVVLGDVDEAHVAVHHGGNTICRRCGMDILLRRNCIEELVAGTAQCIANGVGDRVDGVGAGVQVFKAVGSALAVRGEGYCTSMDTAVADFREDCQLAGIDCGCAGQGDLGQPTRIIAYTTTDHQGCFTGNTW